MCVTQGGEPPCDRSYRRGREERKRRKRLNDQILPAALRARDALPMAVFSFSVPTAPVWTAKRSQGRVTHVASEGRSCAPTSGLRRRGSCQPGWRPRVERPAAARSSVSVRLCRCYAAAFGVGCRKR
ncbi:uncharacterized protein RG961_014670 isoform 1-T1 [Leptosomus discolor]